MPNWSDDEGRCHFEVNGVPCYRSSVGCPAHGGATSKAKRLTQGERDAYQRGAEAMREAAMRVVIREVHGWLRSDVNDEIRALPIPEDKQ